MCIQTAELYAEPPNDIDMEMAISKLKDGTATGHYQILTELIKDERKRAQ
jgi:muramidase (phage lysozyme)